MFEKMGLQLQEARMAAKMSREEAASRIKIDLRFLEKMEQGDFTFLGEVYVKAFLRDYAKLLKLNPDLLNKQFNAAKAGVAGEEEQEEDATVIRAFTPGGTQEIPSFSNTSLSNEKLVQQKRKFLIFGSVGVFVIAVLLYILFSSGDPELVVKERPFEEVVEQNKQRYENPVKETAEPVGAVTDSLTLRISATDSVWVRIVSDAVKPNEFALIKGSVVSVKAGRDFDIHLGNSYAVMLQLNNKPLVLPEKRARVYKAIITKDGVK